MPATAKPDRGPPGQAKGLSLGIKDLKVAFYSDRSVVINRNFRGCHLFSLSNWEYARTFTQRQDTNARRHGQIKAPQLRSKNPMKKISTLERTDQPRRTRQGCRPSG